MTQPEFPEGNAVVYCDKAFATTYGKTAHGLVRRTKRYNVSAVIDSDLAGKDAGQVLDGRPNGIPIIGGISEALEWGPQRRPTHFVIGLATDGGVLSPEARAAVAEAIRSGLNVDCGLHQFLTEDAEIMHMAKVNGVKVRDVRKPPPRKDLHFFSGKIEEVDCLKIAILGTDSAIGKRTTAWVLVDALNDKGYRAVLVGTGQTAWFQGVKYGICLDSLVNDFVAGEIEHAVWSAWKNENPDVIIIEGQGSLMNPAYPGGFEIMAAGRPDELILQHAPDRLYYDGFPGYPIHSLRKQMKAVEMISGKPVIAITINHEGLKEREVFRECEDIEKNFDLPAVDVLLQSPACLLDIIIDDIKTKRKMLREVREVEIMEALW